MSLGEPGPRRLLLLALLLAAALCARAANAPDPDVATVRGFLDEIIGSGKHLGAPDKQLRMGRTFGQKRIQFMLMPMIYKMGVMMTMLAVLTVISLKGLMIGVALLVLKLSTIFGKLYASWPSHDHSHLSSGWSPHQPVHLHLHHDGTYGHQNHPYSGWESVDSNSPHEYYYKG